MYTCNTCSLQFQLPEDQRSHMKSDWHRYNLKRRVASLPAIEESLFNEKVSKLSIVEDQDQDQEDGGDNKKKSKQVTKKELRRKEKEELLLRKRELLEIAKRNMINSLKNGELNKDKLETSEQEETKTPEVTEAPEVPEVPEAPEVETTPEIKEVEESQAPEEEINEDDLTEEQLLAKIMAEKLKNKVDIPLGTCLFCAKKFPDFETSTIHMFKNHGFYIPEQKYLVDKEGLVQYMAEKIGVGNLCIVCDYQGRTLEAVRAHMLSKQHCRIPYESETEKLEISEFYDFTETYKQFEIRTVDGAEGDDGDWEDLEDGEIVEGSDDEEDDESEVGEELPQQISYDDGVELHLPTGVKVGHRSMVRYFKQNLRPESELSEGQGTVIAAESRHLLKVADRQAFLEKKRIWKNESHGRDRDDRRAAKFINNQPYYRDQLLQ